MPNVILRKKTASQIASADISSKEFDFKKLLPILSGVGCGFLLCILLMIGLGYYLAQEQLQPIIANLNNLATPTISTTLATPTLSATIILSNTARPTVTNSPTATTLPETSTPTSTPLPSATPARPEFGAITFAPSVEIDDYTPIEPDIEFKAGLTEIHAIFDYAGLLETDKWERIWYLDGEEILRSPTELWSGEQEGRFDYFIDANGDPLPNGQWMLALYVNNQLMVTGTFSIGTVIEPTATTIATSTRPAQVNTNVQPSITPTSLPVPTVIQSAETYKIAYTKWDGGQHKLYVADTNGNNEKFLLNRAAGPSWTPDGQQIFFYGEEGIDRQFLDDGRELTFDTISNGIVAFTNAVALPDTPDAVLYQDISWKQGGARWANVSPDGQMVAYDASLSRNTNYRIYFLGTSANGQHQFEIMGEHADWSPNSQQLVYRSGRNGTTGLWISNRNDTGHRLLSNGGADSFPAWSPDGQTIAFSRDENGNVDIYTIQVDGTKLLRLTTDPSPDTLPVYTPDGSLIFRSARNGWGIWKMNPDGQNQVELIPSAPVGPDWSYSRMDVQ